MKPNEQEDLRLNVDEETKRFLEEITDRLNDAMVDFVKREDLKQCLQEVDSHLSGIVQAIGVTQEKSLADITQRFQEAENSNDKLKGKLFEIETSVSDSLHGARVEAMGALGTIWQNVTNIDANISDMAKQQNALNEKVDTIDKCIGTLASQISALTSQLSQLNKPWWRKLLG